MNDCGYYFDADYLAYETTLMFSQFEFFHYTGSYQLPCSEGSVSITQDQKTGQLNVHMVTRGSRVPYQHPSVVVDPLYVCS